MRLYFLRAGECRDERGGVRGGQRGGAPARGEVYEEAREGTHKQTWGAQEEASFGSR